MAVKLPIYMDHHATTPVDPRVLEDMLPFFLEKFGNAASRNHVFGWEAEQAVEDARKQVAALIHASPKEIIFTSGATESDNLAIKGVAWRHRERGNHVVTCMTEHRAVLDSCQRLEQEGFRVTYLPVDKLGQVDPRRRAAGHRRPDHSGDADGRQQRNRRAQPTGRGRAYLSGEARQARQGSAVPLRRHAGDWQGAV